MQLNLKMLAKAIEDNRLAPPVKEGEVKFLLVHDYAHYIDSHNFSDDNQEPNDACMYQLMLVSKRYGKGSNTWFEWEVKLS